MEWSLLSLLLSDFELCCGAFLGSTSSGGSDGLGPIVLAGVYCDDSATSLLECGISDAELLAECTHHTDLELQCSGMCNKLKQYIVISNIHPVHF